MRNYPIVKVASNEQTIAIGVSVDARVIVPISYLSSLAIGLWI